MNNNKPVMQQNVIEHVINYLESSTKCSMIRSYCGDTILQVVTKKIIEI